jgi:hypothetical protein
MFLIRLLGGLFLVLALMLLGADAITMLEQGIGLVTRSLDQILGLIFGGSLAAWSEATFPVSVAQPLNFVLGLPAWMFVGAIALLFIIIDILVPRHEV